MCQKKMLPSSTFCSKFGATNLDKAKREHVHARAQVMNCVNQHFLLFNYKIALIVLISLSKAAGELLLVIFASPEQKYLCRDFFTRSQL